MCLRLVLTILVLLPAGCGGVIGPEGDVPVSGDVGGDDVPGIPTDRNFSAPEGITIWNDRVFVTNANFAYQGSQLAYGAGFVTVIDRVSATVVNVIALPFRNPQEAVVVGDRLWVLCSGVTGWNPADSTVVSRTSGGLAGIDLAGVDTAAAAAVTIPIPTDEGSLVGYPSGIFVHNGMAWVASGTTAAMFLVDLDSGEVVRGSSDPVFLTPETAQNTTVAGPGPDGLMTVGLFNDDKVFLFDPEGGSVLDQPWPPAVVGQQGMIDGIIDIESDGARTYLLMGLANQILDFDTVSGPSSGVRKLAANLLTPNRMKLSGSNLYVVNSGDNSLSVIDTDTGAAKSFGLPVNCNPWDLDLSGAGGAVSAWVSCLKSNMVVSVSAADGALVEVE